MPEITIANWFGDIVSHPQVVVEANSVTDFTPFHDEIRKVTGDFLVGKIRRCNSRRECASSRSPRSL